MQNLKQKTCCIYCRVSTNKQAQEGESIDIQKNICLGLARDRNYQILPDGKVWSEPFTGTKDSRPVFDEMIEFIKNSRTKIDYLIIRDIDRLTRGGSGSYQRIKNTLSKYGTELIDSYGMIQPQVNSLEFTGFAYPWSKYSPSGMAETIKAEVAMDERRDILTRMIGAEIELVKSGYHIGPPCDGYNNEKIITEDGKKRPIQVADTERAKYIIKMFELRASNKYSDLEIVDKINVLGYRTRIRNKRDKKQTKIIGQTGGKKLSIKQLQRIIQKPAYAGIIVHKWTNGKPIKAQYKGLVSLELYNKANRGKVYIKDLGDDKFQLFHDYKVNKNIKPRMKVNHMFLYKFLPCPFCGKQMLGSSSRGKSGKYFPSYHCARGHKHFGLNKKTFEDSIESYIKGINPNQDLLDSFELVLMDTYEKRKKDIEDDNTNITDNLEELKIQKKQAVDNLLSSQSAVVKAELEKRIEKFETEIVKNKEQINNLKINKSHISNFTRYAKYLMEHLKVLLLDSDNFKQKQALFELVFEKLPNINEIINGTPRLSLIFAVSSGFGPSKSHVVARRGVEPLFHG